MLISRLKYDAHNISSRWISGNHLTFMCITAQKKKRTKGHTFLKSEGALVNETVPCPSRLKARGSCTVVSVKELACET